MKNDADDKKELGRQMCFSSNHVDRLYAKISPTKMFRCNAGDPSAILKLMDAVEHAAYPHRYQ